MSRLPSHTVKNGYRRLKNYRLQLYRKDIDDPIKSEQRRTYLIILEGSDKEIIEVDNYNGDDMCLEYSLDGDEHECAITSKPLQLGQTHVYFTRNGFKGTMAWHKDTLLDADAYKPSSVDDIIEEYEDDENVDINKLKEALEEKEKDKGFHGRIEALHGSKKTLREMNKAKRVRALLKVQKTDKTKALGLIGIGVVAGIIIAEQFLGNGGF